MYIFNTYIYIYYSYPHASYVVALSSDIQMTMLTVLYNIDTKDKKKNINLASK